MKQTKFITKIIGLSLCVIFLSNLSCNDPKAKSNSTSEVSPLFFKLSLLGNKLILRTPVTNLK